MKNFIFILLYSFLSISTYAKAHLEWSRYDLPGSKIGTKIWLSKNHPQTKIFENINITESKHPLCKVDSKSETKVITLNKTTCIEISTKLQFAIAKKIITEKTESNSFKIMSVKTNLDKLKKNDFVNFAKWWSNKNEK